MRENILAIRLNDDEWNRISDMAESTSLPISSYVRSFVLQQKPPRPRARGVSVEAVAALNRVGSLLNQIARAGNFSKTLSAEEVRQTAFARKRLLEIAYQIESNST